MLKRLKVIRFSAALLCISAVPVAAQEVGINAAIEGQVTLQTGTEQARPAVIKAPVLLGDAVKSAVQSRLQILLNDKTTFTVGPQAELTIDEFVYNPNANSNKVSATVKRGIFRYMSGDVAKVNPDSVTIVTPTASMGVRGTFFEGMVGAEAITLARLAGVVDSAVALDSQGASLIVLRGPGGATNTGERIGAVDVTTQGGMTNLSGAGYASFVHNSTHPPSAPFLLPRELLERFDAGLRSRPTSLGNYDPFGLDPHLLRSILRELEQEDDIFDPLRDLDIPQHDQELETEELDYEYEEEDTTDTTDMSDTDMTDTTDTPDTSGT